MGLVVLFVILLYLAALVAAPAIAYRWAAQSDGWSSRERKGIAAIAFAILFLPMFWDWIPTVWAYSYYCDTYFGLAISRTPQQWKKENPGVAETLVRQTPSLSGGSIGNRYYQLNQRFRWEIRNTDRFLTIVQRDETLVDSHTGDVLIRYIDFFTSHNVRSIQSLRDVKVWLNRNSCEPEGQRKTETHFSRLRLELQNIGTSR